jgi:hypothetical protein
MATEILTDAQISLLIAMPKRVENPGAKTRTVNKHTQRDYRVQSEDGKHTFALFVRQSTVLPDGFSAGLRWLAKSGEDVMLVRFNGPNHPHSNKLEGERFEFKCHVHQATERYLAAGKKDEGYAEPSGEYKTLNGALHCLVKRCNIAGLNTEPDEPDLFD